MTDLPTFDPSDTDKFVEYVKFKDFYDNSSTYHLVFCVLRSDISDDLWDLSMQKMRNFVRWIKQNDIRFHFVFDVHTCEIIPIDRVYELQTFLSKKRDFISKYLHSSVIITSNRVVEMLVTTAFQLQKPLRPMKICLTCNSCAEINDMGIPWDTWTEAIEFLRLKRLTS